MLTLANHFFILLIITNAYFLPSSFTSAQSMKLKFSSYKIEENASHQTVN